MPRKIPILEMTKWLESYEQGRSEAKIAKRAKRDVWTVKRGIEQARRQREVLHSRAELLKEALENHQRELLSVVTDVQSTIGVPAPDLELTEAQDKQCLPVRLSGIAAKYETREGWAVALEAEKKTTGKLVQEHLRSDPLWRDRAAWQKTLEAHLSARTLLMRRAAELLWAKTGYGFGEESSSPPFLIYETAVRLLYQAALHIALGISSVPDMEDRIGSDYATGEVRAGKGTLLANAPGKEEECRTNILVAWNELQMSREVGVARETYRELVQATAKTRKVAEEITLLNLVPGHCRVCKRL